MPNARTVGAAAEKSLLLVDDDPVLLRITKRALELRAYQVVACRSAEEALDRLISQTFDVMLSDVQMPGMTGLELLRAVRERDLDIPVVLLTGSPDVATAAAAIEYGAFQYLIKPLTDDRLQEVLDRAANIGRMARVKREWLEQIGSTVFPIADRAGIDAAFDRALASFWMAFQPIVRATDGSVFGQEALLRTAELALPHPRAVLEAAERAGRLHDLGRSIRASVGNAMASAPADWCFFVNIHAQDLLDPWLYLPSAPLSRISERVVFEITERASLDAISDVSDRVAKLRELGFRIALDDLGAGYAGLNSFTQLEPEFVELDISLVRDVHQSGAQRKIVGSIVRLCHDMGKVVIAVGVENQAERDALAELGCDLLQGYFFAKPGKEFTVPRALIHEG
jgi:EAL domain-containing protein (putative c-di-GMP-specific phosphodiesterase class I)